MSLIRSVSVGFQGANRKIEEVSAQIPAEWVTGQRDALTEIYENPKIRTKIAVTPGSALWAKISDPWDPAASARVIRG